MQRAAVREFQRVYTNATCLSADFVRRQVATRVRSEQLWRELRPSGDWAGVIGSAELSLIAQAPANLRRNTKRSGVEIAASKWYPSVSNACKCSGRVARCSMANRVIAPRARLALKLMSL